VILDVIIPKFDPANRQDAEVLAAFASMGAATRHAAMKSILGNICIQATGMSYLMAPHCRDSRKHYSIKSFRHRIRHRHPLVSLAHTICIILPLFVSFTGDIAIESNLRALASPNDPYGKDDAVSFTMSHHYFNLLHPLSSLRTVVLALDGQNISSIWPWRVLEGMIHVFSLGGIDVHLESDIHCIQAGISMPCAPHPLVTSWTVSNLAYGDSSLAVFARVLKRIEFGLRHLTVQWNPRDGELILLLLHLQKLTPAVQEPLVEAFERCIKNENVSLAHLVTLQWTVHDLFVGEVDFDSDNIWLHYLPIPKFTLGGLTTLLDALPCRHQLQTLNLDLQGVMTEHTAFWNEHTPDIRREFSYLQLYLSRPVYANVQVNADILFMAWKAGAAFNNSAMAELWACAAGVSIPEAQRVKDIFRKEQTKFPLCGWWNVQCLSTAETALWDDSPTDALDATGMWFDEPSMPLLSQEDP
jgi:hypothetical protein